MESVAGLTYGTSFVNYMPNESFPCDFCENGYHIPFERFEQIAVFPDGPTFLKRCKLCGMLWHETLRSVKHVSAVEALALYPGAKI